MDETFRRNELIKAMNNIEYRPAVLENENANIDRYTKVPLSRISAMGVAFEPLAAAFQSVFLGQSGGSGIYFVNAKGGSLVKSVQESGFIGAITQGNNQVGGGMANLNPLVCNPTMLFMAAALMNIEKKLDSIMEAQKEIYEFLEQKEKSKLRGNLNFLSDILNNYKYNWNNEKYKNSNHIKVLDIKQESEQSILFYSEQIKKKAKKQSFLHSDKDVKDKLKKLQSEFKEYQLSLYLYAFSSFLEVMLLENFESAYLEAVAGKIEDYAFQYREQYTECYNQIEGEAKTSIQSHVLKGLAIANKAAGEAVAKIPIVSKSQVDETLIATGNRLGSFNDRRTEQALEELVNHQNSAVYIFVQHINTVNRLYNQSLELLFDSENIYIGD